MSTTSDSFEMACNNGNEEQAKELYGSDKSILRREGSKGLLGALFFENHSICRWLLSLPDIDVNSISNYNSSILHVAATTNTPFDLLIALTRLASKETIDLKWSLTGQTALDLAVENNKLSTAIYLSWLGAQCKDENRKYDDVTLQTWLDAGCQQDAPMWAVAAKDLKALKQLAVMGNVIFAKPTLRNLAELFGFIEIKCFLEDNQNLKIYANQILCDFQVVINNRIFPCHKIFLAKHSEPFQALIESKMRQNLPMKTELENCPNETVAESFIKFFYIGAIDKDVLDWHIVSFLHLSDFYQITEMHTIVEDSMINQLCNQNVKEFLIAAEKYRGERVKVASFDFLAKNRGIWAENVGEWKPFISRELLCEIAIKLA